MDSRIVNLGSLCTQVQYGYTDTADTSNLDGIGFVRGTDISTNDIMWDAVPSCLPSDEKFKKYSLEVDDILITRMGSIGTSAIVKEVPRPSVFASYLIRFKVDKTKANPLYISYVLKSSLFTDYVNGANSSGVQPNINAKTLSAFEFPLPDRPTQDRVAELLNDFESAAFNNRKIGKLLSKTMDALFSKMCTNVPSTNVELRETGITIESGSRPKGGVAGISEGIPSIGAESIAGIGVYDYSKTKYVPEEFFNKMRKGIPQDFDVLLYKDGGKPGEFKPRLGMFGLGFPFSDYAINEHVFLLRSDQLGQPFLYFWLNQEKVLDVLRNAGIKAAIPGINQQDVNRLIVEVPEVEVIDAFNEKAMPVIEEILRLAGESRVLLQLRDSYLKRFIVELVSPPAEMIAS